MKGYEIKYGNTSQNYSFEPKNTVGSLLFKDAPQKHRLSFNNQHGEVGYLDFSGSQLRFVGSIEDSAVKFIDFINPYIESQLRIAREEERTKCETEFVNWMRELWAEELKKEREAVYKELGVK
jgi:hypothetical protein